MLNMEFSCFSSTISLQLRENRVYIYNNNIVGVFTLYFLRACVLTTQIFYFCLQNTIILTTKKNQKTYIYVYRSVVIAHT